MSDSIAVTFLPELGSEFAGYRLEAYVARGGMGVVYQATHLSLSRRVALKLLAPELAEDADFRQRFLKEAELAAGLEHPNVVPVYDAGEEQGLLYLAMRYLPGGDLSQLLQRQGRLSLERTLAIVEQVAGALDAAHELSLVHRDVKPANILFNERHDTAYLSDFGVAKRQSSKGLTRTGSFLGSVDYCAPEQIESAVVDGRVDVYALGGVCFHCLTGQPPYVRETALAVMSAHLREPPPALSRVRPDLPSALDGVLVVAMAKHAEVRYDTAGAFAKALREAAAGSRAKPTVPGGETPTLPGAPPLPPAPPAGLETDVLPGRARTADAPPPPPPASPGKPARAWVAIALAACALLVAIAGVGVGVLVTRDGGESTLAAPTTTTATGTTTSSATESTPPQQPVTSSTSERAKARRANQAYVRAIDEMLIDSAQTRGDLGTVIDQVNSSSIPYGEAAAAIDAITDQRRSLLSAVSSVSVPPPFIRSATLLRRSLVASIDDDLAIESWIDARYTGDTAAEDYYWKRNVKLSTEASVAKTAFLREYNSKRRALLNRAPLDVRY